MRSRFLRNFVFTHCATYETDDPDKTPCKEIQSVWASEFLYMIMDSGAEQQAISHADCSSSLAQCRLVTTWE